MSGHAALPPRVYRAGLAMGQAQVEVTVFDLPGCAFVARDEGAALATLPVVIAEHIAWLDQHGDVTRDSFPFEVEVEERVDLASLRDIADGEFCFQDDLRPATREEIETAVRRMGYARVDLLRSVRHLPDAVLDFVPPPDAVREDERAPGVRSIRAILEHVASADGYYAGNVGEAPSPAVDRHLAGDIFTRRQQAVERLRSLAAPELEKVWRRHQAWQDAGNEEWTVRKALRRMIAHERAHTKEIEQRLAWLLLGPPMLVTESTVVRR